MRPRVPRLPKRASPARLGRAGAGGSSRLGRRRAASSRPTTPSPIGATSSSRDRVGAARPRGAGLAAGLLAEGVSTHVDVRLAPVFDGTLSSVGRPGFERLGPDPEQVRDEYRAGRARSGRSRRRRRVAPLSTTWSSPARRTTLDPRASVSGGPRGSPTQVSGGYAPSDARPGGRGDGLPGPTRDAAPATAGRRARSCHPARTGSGRQPVCRRAPDRRPMRRAAPKPAIVTSRPATMSKR